MEHIYYLMLVNLFESFIISINIVQYFIYKNIILSQSNIHLIINILFCKEKKDLSYFYLYFYIKKFIYFYFNLICFIFKNFYGTL